MRKGHLIIYFWAVILMGLGWQTGISKGSLDTLDSKIGGLKFLSKQVFTSERTAFSLFPNCKKVSSNFTFSFDFSIYNTKRFGYIFRIINCKEDTNQPYLHLLYNPNTDTLNIHRLELYSPITRNKIEFSFPAEKLKNMRIKLQYNTSQEELILSCNGVQRSIKDIKLNEKLFNIIFGLWGQNTDVSAMYIRNVRFSQQGETTHFWPLNQKEGTSSIDKVAGLKSEVNNPVWLLKEHFYWQKLESFEADEMVGIIYHEKNHSIYLINQDSLVIFSPFSGNHEVLKYSNERPFPPNEHFSIYNKSTNKIISYDFKFLRSPNGKRTYSTLDEKSLTWTPIDQTRDWVGNHHHNIFWNQGDTNLTLFGGYANFTYFNEFSMYNLSSNTWDDLEFTGDVIYPRTHAVVGREEGINQYYIYGGFGNEEGQQSLGGRTFFDLYEVDISNKRIKKLLDLKGMGVDFVPRGQLLVDPGGEDFYTIGSKPVEKSFLRLYHINLPSESIEPISDSIPVIFTNMAGNAFLYQNEIAQELYCVTRENNEAGNSIISIYRLRYPPSSIFNIKAEAQTYFTELISVLFLILLIGFVLFIYLQKKKKNIPLKSENKQQIEYIRENKNAIWFLGGFNVFDPKGEDITYRFSKKLRELFILVFFETINNQGISSKDLSEILWPEKDKNQQKNNRGVTINHLRKALEDLEGIFLVNENNKWKIIYEDGFNSDFINLKKSLEGIESVTNPNYIISMFSFGNILPEFQFNWLDKHKSIYESEALSILYKVCTNFYSQRKFLSCFETAQLIHQNFEPLDEKALGLKISSLNKMKSFKKANQEFEQFKQRYSTTYKEEYLKTIDEIEHL